MSTEKILNPGPTAVLPRRNIYIVGRAEAGKKTLANHIAGSTVFPVPLDHRSARLKSKTYEETCDSHCGNYKYTFVLFDTEKTDFDAFSSYLRQTESVNLFLFVVRKGNNERQDIRTIISRLDTRIKHYSALVVTGCEDMQPSERNEFLHSLQCDSAFEKGMFAVGFPESSIQHAEWIKKDEKRLQNLVKESGEALSLQDILRAQETSWFLRFCLCSCLWCCPPCCCKVATLV